MADGSSTAGSRRFREQVARLLADATAATSEGDTASARTLVEAALVLAPDDAGAQRLLESISPGAPGQRRQLTVMFCDVVGSTPMSSHSDPEVVHDVLRTYQAACSEVVELYDGHLAQFIGDGAMVYFGHPIAHEDDPVRAVRAGLDLLDELANVAGGVRRRHGIELAVRIAIHTGFVVRADMGAPGRVDRNAVVGETPNIAARLQDHARPGTLVISDATHELVKGFFDIEHIGAVHLRGVGRPIDAYEVLRRGTAINRLDAAAALTPFVNRDRERGLLEGAWAEAVGGGTCAILLRGEAGIGKSRLAAVIADAAARARGAVVRGPCSTFHRSTHLYPVRHLLEGVCGIDARSDPAASLPALRAALSRVGRTDLLGVFADLLGIEPDGSWSVPQLSGAHLRELTMSSLIEWLSAAAARQPVLAFIDDVQWADPSTVELIGRILARRIPSMFLVMTARDDFEPPWSSPIDVVELHGLAHDDLLTLAESLPEAADLDAVDVEGLLTRSDGVPLFLEELVRGAAAGISDHPLSGAAAPSSIPAALRDPLLARLSSPDVDLGLAQTIATIGQVADHELLLTVTGLTDAALADRIERLVSHHLIEVVGDEFRAYRFRHHLLGRLAYETQLLAVRRRRHSAIADVLTALDFGGVPGDAGAIAYHLEHGSRIAEAVEAYVVAAHEGQEKGATVEAIAVLDHALTLVAGVADEKDRTALELRVRQARGMVGVSAWGYTSAEAGEDFGRCLQLAERLGPSPEHLPSLNAAFIYSLIRGELGIARRILAVDRGRFDVGPEDGPPTMGGWATLALFEGRLAEALVSFEEYFDSDYVRTLVGVDPAWPFPDDPAIIVAAFRGLTYSLAGRPADAARTFAWAEERASSLPFPNGPFSLVYARVVAMVAALCTGDNAWQERLVPSVAEIAQRHGFLFFQVCADLHQSFADARAGGPISGMDVPIMAWRLAGLGIWDQWLCAQRAALLLDKGDASGALLACEEAAGYGARSGVSMSNAEIRRLRGLARIALGDPDGVDDLREAGRIAADQGALVYELRARADAVRHGDDIADLRLLAGAIERADDGVPEAAAGRLLVGRAGGAGGPTS